MRYFGISVLLLGLLIAAAGGAKATTRDRCRADVIEVRELPYAPIGSWLLKATALLTYPDHTRAKITLVGQKPWQLTIRRGDRFWLDCARLSDPYIATLDGLRIVATSGVQQ
ncbi:hypothetical protein [Bradyrhizobium sp.]|uniref:hypothetical protein n=1 Tax=Bradyrhizobium sp. TaxID=376 RepID=UPI0039E6BA79